MSGIDWIVLFVILAGISIYGTWKARGSNTMESYVRADKEVHWKTIGLAVMATQASAITFLSTPGQAFDDGMQYIQIYFGLPLAMIILSATILPKYLQANIYTAYEFLERRFDLRVRLLTAFLFLLQRGMASGLNIVAPAILLSAVLSVSLTTNTLLIGGMAIVYTTIGGAKAVAQTQKLQMSIMFGGMIFALIYAVAILPADISFYDSLSVAGALGRLETVDFSFNLHNRYTFWSGVAGGLMLSLSYFGTDQSQVQRYISGVSLRESRLGLLFNAVLKIPLQFIILLCGVMVFVFYQFTAPPLSFIPGALKGIESGEAPARLKALNTEYQKVFADKSAALRSMLESNDESARANFKQLAKNGDAEMRKLSKEASSIIQNEIPGSGGRDTDFVFITFILNYLPFGLIGLLVAMIFCGAMSTASAELHSLGTTMVVDFYARVFAPGRSDEHYVRATKLATAFWGAVAMVFALFVPLTENLIQAINIIGSLFYGNILGIFVLALSNWNLRPASVLISAVVTEIFVIALHFTASFGFLWYNVIGTLTFLALAGITEALMRGLRRSNGGQTS